MSNSAKPCMSKEIQEMLNPCPYCVDGTSNLLIIEHGFYYYVECQTCNMTSPYALIDKDKDGNIRYEYIISIWNNLSWHSNAKQLEEERNFLAWKLEDLCRNWAKGKECTYNVYSQEYWLNLAKDILAM